MEHRICPWWLGYLLVNPLRRIWQNPRTILQPYVKDRMVVLEPGCGMGFFTIELARLAGPRGKVVAVDLQPKMLDGLLRRARGAGVENRIEARLASQDGLHLEDLTGTVDFALAFAVVHELPDEGRFFAEMQRALKGGGKLLVAEPRGHVKQPGFQETTLAAERAGFRVTGSPSIRWSWTAVLRKE